MDVEEIMIFLTVAFGVLMVTVLGLGAILLLKLILS